MQLNTINFQILLSHHTSALLKCPQAKRCIQSNIREAALYATLHSDLVEVGQGWHKEEVSPLTYYKLVLIAVYLHITTPVTSNSTDIDPVFLVQYSVSCSSVFGLYQLLQETPGSWAANTPLSSPVVKKVITHHRPPPYCIQSLRPVPLVCLLVKNVVNYSPERIPLFSRSLSSCVLKISLYITVNGLFLLTQSDHVLHWRSQSPENELFYFSLHNALLHKHHDHWICLGPIFLTLFTDFVPIYTDLTLLTAPIENAASWTPLWLKLLASMSQ